MEINKIILFGLSFVLATFYSVFSREFRVLYVSLPGLLLCMIALAYRLLGGT